MLYGADSVWALIVAKCKKRKYQISFSIFLGVLTSKCVILILGTKVSVSKKMSTALLVQLSYLLYHEIFSKYSEAENMNRFYNIICVKGLNQRFIFGDFSKGTVPNETAV